MTFRFDIGERVRVVSHPARPAVTVVDRWPGAKLRDFYDENIYAVSGFVTLQRESSLAAERFVPIQLEPLAEWRMAGRGSFRRVAPGTIESEGGPGVLWFARAEFDNFVLAVDWRVSTAEDNSGVFIRIPALDGDDPDRDWHPASAEGYEIQIDERGLEPHRGLAGSALHRTGAVYGLAPATSAASEPVGSWNIFVIEARSGDITVVLNGVLVSRLTGGSRRRSGYVGFQAHHAGSAVRFRNLQIKTI